ncbi:hypothetical protein [Bradyrhizobium sp. Ash2021]|uniref:hypothetical protein n=1 Tax=Bradyrhizobium sp. Ash2021 TaxID=2954771 RepID=UPI00281615B5|nr:hypothetical protein [Bradyrhizobium sp. Ash2021]WMT74649.1 hypothetical protein NL528_43460 [Bradyrhizobium sp. Ash2021]
MTNEYEKHSRALFGIASSPSAIQTNRFGQPQERFKSGLRTVEELLKTAGCLPLLYPTLFSLASTTGSMSSVFGAAPVSV